MIYHSMTMASTTVEKAIFIIFGLALFSAIGFPIMNTLQNIIVVDEEIRDFDNVVNKIELGIRAVEYNGSLLYSAPVSIMGGMKIVPIANSWGIEVTYSTAQSCLAKSIYSRTCPITLTHDNEEGVHQLIIEKVNGLISVRFLKDGMQLSLPFH